MRSLPPGRIAWCTPYAPASAIGRVSAQVVTALRALGRHEVEIRHPAGAGGRTDPDPGRPLPPDPGAEVLASYDHVVYHLGNHAGYHGDILRLLRRRPGLVVLHDLTLVDLVVADLARRDEGIIREFTRWYGDEGRRAAATLLADPDTWRHELGVAQRFPLLESALENATGVVTHSHYAAEIVRAHWWGDVEVLPLPAPPVGDAAKQHPDGSADLLARAGFAVPSDTVLILQAGTHNPEKRIDVVIEALALTGVAERAHLVVAGQGDAAAVGRATELARRHGVDASVTVAGEVPDEVMAALRARADIATVLRHPCTEAASAVLVDSLAFGLAVVSVDDGCYAETPDDAVVRVPVPPVAGDVAAALRGLVDSADRRAALSAAARRTAREKHDANRYAAGIAAFLDQAGSALRRRDVADSLSDVLAGIHATPGDPVVDRLVDVAVELFGPTPRVLPVHRPTR